MTGASWIQHLDLRETVEETSLERREATRFALLIRAAKLIAGNREYLCIVRDVSVDGAKIRHYGALPECNQFQVELSNGHVFPARLIWVDETHAGLRFEDRVDLSRIISPSSGDRPRRKLRIRTEAPALVRWQGNCVPAQVKNLSREGAGIRFGSYLAIDQLVQIEVDTLPPIYAKVRWRRGEEYGLVFETTLSFEELASAISALNSR